MYIKKLFHRHKWIKYKTVPEVGTTWFAGQIDTVEGTAVFEKCECGKKRKIWYQLEYKLIEGFLVHQF